MVPEQDSEAFGAVCTANLYFRVAKELRTESNIMLEDETKTCHPHGFHKARITTCMCTLVVVWLRRGGSDGSLEKMAWTGRTGQFADAKKHSIQRAREASSEKAIHLQTPSP